MRADLRVLPTADLGPAGRQGLRGLLETAFAPGYGDEAWDHALGGLHVLAGPPEAPVGHAALVLRRLLHGGVALRTGYVESVAVHPDRQGHGLGGELMAEVERLVRGGYQLGALGAADRAAPLYRRRGWRVWTGPLAGLTPDGVLPTPEESGAVHVLPVAVELDPATPLVCDWRDGELW